ncbi:MAG: hypothetical protein R3E64_02930 [Halioglobus sp.]
MTITVVQWTSGGVARECVRAIQAHPELELVGMYAYSQSKAGRDAGELVGIDAVGIQATSDIDALIALRPDCVSYSPLYPNVDHLVTLLEAGINVVTTSNFLTGWAIEKRPDKYGPNGRQRIQRAAEKGNATIFGSGMNPGHINYLAGILCAHCHRIEHIRVTESVDVTAFVGDANMTEIGFGLPANNPGHEDRICQETRVFGDGLELMAQMIGVTLDDIRCSVKFAHATQDIDAPGRFISKGSVAAVKISWQGLVNGVPLLENLQVWVVGEQIDPLWKTEHGYLIDIKGEPGIHNRMIPIPAGDLSALSREQMNAVGMCITGLPSINAIPVVCAAPAGIRTYKDLPAIAGFSRA